MKETSFRKELSIEGMLGGVRDSFNEMKELKAYSSRGIDIVDTRMCGVAVFGLKYPSLLQFDNDARFDEPRRTNLRNLYGVQKAPSDTRMREQLDKVDPVLLRKPFKAVWAMLQRGKGLVDMEYWEGHYLAALDGTGYFSSNNVFCQHCCEKHHRDGTVTYPHQMLGAVLIHPERREVFPFAPEPILKHDGSTKNDGERNASKRLLNDLKREHPHLKLIIVEDGLASNAPHIQPIVSLGYHYILSAKPGDHRYLFDFVDRAPKGQVHPVSVTTEDGTEHRFRYMNKIPLNEASIKELSVNFLEYWEISKDGKRQRFSWVTDLLITDDNVMKLMRGGRARWRIENEAFNTLKNQGYHFEHNFGHGYEHLSSTMALLMFLAFLIDQVQQHGCPLFQQALEKTQRKLYFWNELRGIFLHYVIPSWGVLYHCLIFGFKRAEPIPNTS